MNDVAITLVIAVIGSNAFTALTQHYLTKKSRTCIDQELIKSTLAAVTYSLLSKEVECMLTKEFATPEERRSLTIMYEAYKSNGWNGDMEARIVKVYNLPTICLHKEREEV